MAPGRLPLLTAAPAADLDEIVSCAARPSPPDRARVRFWARLAAVAALLVAGAASDAGPATLSPRAPAPEMVEGLSRFASAGPAGLVVRTTGGDRDFVAGVNLGATVPGSQPGEVAVPRETWRRWFPEIAAVGFQAVRVYTIQPPHFYEELRDYNLAHPERPLYLVHGVWIPEQEYYATKNVFDPAVRSGFERDITSAVAVVHGDASLPERRGFADGTYTADVSQWLLAWIIGTELDPEVTATSDAINAGMAPYRGRRISATADATPTESWLAEALDALAGAEAARGRTMPIAFTNWPTTDPLRHPDEPLAAEDLVGVDANHVRVTGVWPGGLFASYHVYPYYPNFQRYEDGIADFVHNGKIDAYAGYLTKLREHHAAAGLPLVVAEFGVPSSLGSAHRGEQGRDQGDHSEWEAMQIDAGLLLVQHDVGVSGGFVFEWADEWFKVTWNTVEVELPADRRQLWHDPLTNESYFGVLSVEDATTPVVIDGKFDEWDRNGSQVILESRGAVRQVRAHRDASYLYLHLRFDRNAVWEDEPIVLAFDVVDGAGGTLPMSRDTESEADYAVTIQDGTAEAWVRASNDVNAVVNGRRLGFYDVAASDVVDGSGVWDRQRLVIDRPAILPRTGERAEAEWFDLSPLRRATAEAADRRLDNLVLWAARDTDLELRLPWAMVGFADPSSRQGVVVEPDGTLSTDEVERVGISVGVNGEMFETAGYSWDPWNVVAWSDRPKAGVDALIAAVLSVT